MTIATVVRVPYQADAERIGKMVRGFSLSSPFGIRRATSTTFVD
jgi:hypothetical protein